MQVERVAQYKHDQRLEAARKESREKQLDFLVGQTARYTDMLTEGMQGAAGQPTEEEDRHVNTAERVDRQAELAALQAEAEAPLDEAVLKIMEEEDEEEEEDDDDSDDSDDDEGEGEDGAGAEGEGYSGTRSIKCNYHI